MKKTQWIFGMAALVVAALTLLAGGQQSLGVNSGDKPASGVAVKIDNFSFRPAMLTVPAGTKLTWTNGDDVPHTVVSADKVFKGPVLDTEEKFSYTFTKPRTYSYYCSIHPKMTGKVVVQ